MLRTAMAIAGCLLLAWVPDGAHPVGGSHASSSWLTPELHARSAENVPVCHRAGARWVPLRLPEAAAVSHVGNHGDFVYDTSAGQCCTDADCGSGRSCGLALGLDGVSVIGKCAMAGSSITDYYNGLLLGASLFGGVPVPLSGGLSRDAAGNYSLSFTINGIIGQVALANFVPKDTIVPENSLTPVFIRFPARNGGLITFNAPAFQSYLNLSVATSPEVDAPKLGDGIVDLINATVANFTLVITGPDSYPVVFLDSGGAYSILDIRGVYVQPTSYIGNGSGPAGFYLGLLNGSIVANVLVFREAVYDVRL